MQGDRSQMYMHSGADPGPSMGAIIFLNIHDTLLYKRYLYRVYTVQQSPPIV